MLCLAIDCSAKAASTALVKDGRLLSQYYQNSGLTHSRTLLPMVRDMLSNTDIRLADIDFIAITSGPGSFTGLRIGIATVKGLCWGGDIPCVGVSTLEAMAQNMSDKNGIICSCMDARRNQVYNALFMGDGSSLTRLTADRPISVDELSAELNNYGLPVFLVGDGSDLCYNELAYKNLHFPHPLLQMQNAWGAAVLGEKKFSSGDYCSAEKLIPTYLRLSQAERERLERLKAENQ